MMSKAIDNFWLDNVYDPKSGHFNTYLMIEHRQVLNNKTNKICDFYVVEDGIGTKFKVTKSPSSLIPHIIYGEERKEFFAEFLFELIKS